MKTFLVSFLALSIFASRPSAAESFRTGVVLPLSGPLAEYGVAIQNGMMLAREERRDAFSSCEFFIEDSVYKSTNAVSAFQKLRTTHHIHLLYAFGGPIGEALAPIAENLKLPFLSDSIDSRVSEGREFVLRYANRKEELGEALVASLVRRGVKSVAIVRVANQYIAALLAGIEHEAHGKVTIATLAEVNPEDADLKFLAAKVQGTQADAVGLFLLPGQLSSLARNVRLKGKVIFGGDFLESPHELEQANGALEGALYPNNVVENAFKQRYERRFGNQSQIKFAAEGYDVANFIADVLCSSKAWMPGEVLQRMKSRLPWPSVQGLMTYRESPKGDKYFAAPVVTLIASRSGFTPDTAISGE